MQKDNKKNWMKNPTKKQTMLILLAWIVVIGCSIILRTELFTLNPFKVNNISLFGGHLAITVIMLAVCINYFRNKHKAAI